MEPQYLHLSLDTAPPLLTVGPFLAVIIAEMAVGPDWRNRIADWLLKSGCLYVVAWGVECEEWHDTVDWTNLEAFDYEDIPDDKFVMTTWHSGEPLAEALWFAGHCGAHPDVELEETFLIHVAPEDRRSEMLTAFAESQRLVKPD